MADEKKESKQAVKEGIELAVQVMLDQLHLHAKDSSAETLNASSVRSITDIAKTLNIIHRTGKEMPDDKGDDISNLSADEIRKRAKAILEGGT